MTGLVDTWPVGKGDVVFYTEDPELAKLATELLGQGSTYEYRGRIIGWQFIVPRKKQNFFKMRIANKLGVDSKRVTGGRIVNFDARASLMNGAD